MVAEETLRLRLEAERLRAEEEARKPAARGTEDAAADAGPAQDLLEDARLARAGAEDAPPAGAAAEGAAAAPHMSARALEARADRSRRTVRPTGGNQASLRDAVLQVQAQSSVMPRQPLPTPQTRGLHAIAPSPVSGGDT